MFKLTCTQIAVLVALVDDEETLEERQEFAMCHHSSTKKLCDLHLVSRAETGIYDVTELGQSVLSRELLRKEMRRIDERISKLMNENKEATNALFKFGSLLKNNTTK